jgi:cell division protein FtsB
LTQNLLLASSESISLTLIGLSAINFRISILRGELRTEKIKDISKEAKEQLQNINSTLSKLNERISKLETMIEMKND